MTVKAAAQNIKQNQRITSNNHSSIEELEKKLEELVLEDFSPQPMITLQLLKNASYGASLMCKKYFKLKVFSREAVSLLAIGATVAGVTNNLKQPDNKHILTPLVNDGLFYSSMNLLMYSGEFSYPQMIMANLLAYPVRSQAFLGGFGQIMGGMLGTFFGGRKMGVNVDISAEPIVIKIDPVSFGAVIAEASKQARFVVDKIEQAEENLVMLSFEQGRIALKEAGGIVQVIVDDAIANAFKGAQLTIENFGNVLKARIEQGSQEAKIIINYIPFISKQTSVSIVEGFTHGLLQSFWYSYYRHIENEIKNYVLQTQQTQDTNLIKLLINFVWVQRIRPEFSAQDKENLYKQLLIIVNNPANPIEKLREMFLLIGYAAIHDPSMQVLSSSFWPFSSTNHTKNVIAAIPDPVVWKMLENLDYKTMHAIFPAIQIIRETLLLSDSVNLETIINEYINKIKEQLKLNEQQQKILLSIITIAIASIVLLFYNRNSQYLQTAKNKFPWLFTQEAVQITTLVVTILVITNSIQQQNSVNKEILRCINKLNNDNSELDKQVKRYEQIIFENIDKLKKNIEYITREIGGLHSVVELIENSIEQKYQIQQKAVSFLHDKMKEAHKVAFKTGTFPLIDGNVCNSHGELLPIPEGFEEKDCSFFTAGGSSFNGDVQHHVSFFTPNNTMYLPYAKGGGRCWGAYSVLAAKPVMTEQEIIQKKHEYRLK